jgi:DNA-binding LytR/AlgR family response regulator
MKLNCVVIDDEPLARQGIEAYVERVPYLELTAGFHSPLEASGILTSDDVDILFLDIEMPQVTGLDLLTTLKNPPIVIIITAYPEYALKGYELNVLDYLLKPVSFVRFLNACEKARDYSRYVRKKEMNDEYFFVKCDAKYEKVIVSDIQFIQAMQNYVLIQTTSGRYMTHSTMKYIQEILPAKYFLRVHKSYIVSLKHIDKVEGNVLHVASHQLPISRDNRDEILQKILFDKLLK